MDSTSLSVVISEHLQYSVIPIRYQHWIKWFIADDWLASKNLKTPKSPTVQEELLAMWKVEAELRQKMQAEQAMAEQAMPQEPSIEQTMVQDIATEEQPPEGQRMRLQEEYGQG